MKTRTGFVSNSSSTSFLFCFKGETLDGLCTLLKKHTDSLYFHSLMAQIDLEDCGNSFDKELVDLLEEFDADNLVLSIENYNNTHNGHKLYVRSIEEILLKYKEHLAKDKKYLKETKGIENKNDQDSSYGWALECLINTKRKIQKLEILQSEGFKSIVTIDFGDNEGHFEGKPFGLTLDYCFRDFELKEKDIWIWTESNR